MEAGEAFRGKPLIVTALGLLGLVALMSWLFPLSNTYSVPVGTTSFGAKAIATIFRKELPPAIVPLLVTTPLGDAVLSPLALCSTDTTPLLNTTE